MAKLFLSGMLACSVLFGGAANAWAADPEREARERYDNAVRLYEEGAYEPALVELNRAAELKPSYKLYFNIAQVRFAMNDYAAAMDAYRQYLEKGGDKIPAARREQVQKELNKLAQRVAKLTVEVDVPGAEILVDDALVGKSPLAAPLVVNSGIRRIAVRHPDYLPQSRRVTVAGNVEDRIAFSLLSPTTSSAPPSGKVPPSPAPSTAAAPAPASPARAAEPSAAARPPSSEKSSGSTAIWVGWAVTGVLGASAAVTGIVTLSKNSSLQSDRDDATVSDEQFDDRSSQVRTLATVTDVLIASTLVAGGVSLWLTLGRDSRESAARARTLPPRPRWALGVQPRGVVLRSSF